MLRLETRMVETTLVSNLNPRACFRVWGMAACSVGVGNSIPYVRGTRIKQAAYENSPVFV